MRAEIQLRAPTTPLTANKRYGHWAQRARLVKAWRRAAKLAAEEAGVPRFTHRAHCTVLVAFKDRRIRDVHNWMPTFKACIDGFVDAGVLPDDGPRYLVGPDPRLDDPDRSLSVPLLTFEFDDQTGELGIATPDTETGTQRWHYDHA